MSSITCVTSMNRPYYDQIGRLMIESWYKFWPENVKLLVYQENFQIIDKKNIVGIDWHKQCFENHKDFEDKINNIKELKSIIPASVKFAKKGFAWIAAMQNVDCDILIWIDADVITKNYINTNMIANLLPEDKLIAFFDTYYQVNPNYTQAEYLKRGPGGAAESGFVVINKRHEKFDEYLTNYKKYYNRYESYLGPWYDGNVCFTASYGLQEYVEDLSKHRLTNKTQTPLNRSKLGEYLYHAKAKLKNNFAMIENELQRLQQYDRE